MVHLIRAVVIAKDRDAAEAAFWDYQDRYKGNRRGDPRKIVTIHQVRKMPMTKGYWAILYSVPPKVLKAAHAKVLPSEDVSVGA